MVENDGLNLSSLPDIEGTPFMDFNAPEGLPFVDEEGAEGNEGGEPIKESPNKLLAKWAKEKGLIDYKEEELEDTEEGVLSVFNKNLDSKLEAKIQEYKDSLPEKLKHLINHYDEGVPFHELLESEKRLDIFGSIKPESLDSDPDLQSDVLASYLSYNGLEDKEITEKIKKYTDAGLLLDEARLAHKKLIEIESKNQQALIENAKAEKAANDQKAAKEFQEFQEKIMGLKEIFPGVEISDEQKKKLISVMTTPVEKVQGRSINKIQQMAKNDPTFNAKVAYMAAILNWDFKTLQGKATTKAVQTIKKQVTSFPDEKQELNYSAWKKAINKINKETSIFK